MARTESRRHRRRSWGLAALGFAAVSAIFIVTIPARVGQGAAAVSPTAAAPASTVSAMPGMKDMASAPTGEAPKSHTLINPVLPPLAPGSEHHYTITLRDRTLLIAPGVSFHGWTFDGTAPGPVIHVRQGDTVQITLKNDAAIPHSIDFHAARVAPNVDFRSVNPGQSINFSFQANDPGAFMYHCGTAPVLAHIASGMYGAIIVDPTDALPKVDRSYVLVSSEWYLAGNGQSRPAGLDYAKARHMQPDYVTFNGYVEPVQGQPPHGRPGPARALLCR